MKQRIEQTQHFMYSIGVTGEETIEVNIRDIASTVYEQAGKNNAWFKINSIEVVGRKGGLPLIVKDALTREIVAQNANNTVNVPLPNITTKVRNAGTEQMVLFNKDSWYGTVNVAGDTNPGLMLVRVPANLNNGETTGLYARIEVRVTYFLDHTGKK